MGAAVLIGAWRLRQCTLCSIKVICTHDIERSLVFFCFFIKAAGRIGPENQIKKLL